MVDHIQEIVTNALHNIKKDNKHLIKQKKIIPIVRDGRKGIAEYGPYDVIHIGGAVEVIPKEYFDQLALGGRMWVPVGKRDSQAIFIVDKDLDGNIH